MNLYKIITEGNNEIYIIASSFENAASIFNASDWEFAIKEIKFISENVMWQDNITNYNY